MPDWSSIVDPDTPLVEIFVRGTLVYLVLFGLLRFASQRQSGGLALSDLLVLVLAADAAQNARAGGYRAVPDGPLPVATNIGWSIAIEALAYPALARLAKPRPKPLIEDGVLNGQVMRREFITRDEVMARLRLHGITDLDQVGCAYLEGSGLISVVRRERDPTDQAPSRRRGSADRARAARRWSAAPRCAATRRTPTAARARSTGPRPPPASRAVRKFYR